MPKNFQHNLLAFISMLMIFLFLSLLSQHFGMGVKTDTYFFSLMILSYLSYFVQATWKATQPYYIKLKVEDEKSASLLYSTLLNRIIFFSLLIITLYFLITSNIKILKTQQKDFLDIFIFYILLQNMLLFNKSILNLEKHFASFYLVDIIIYSINICILLLFLEDDITLLAYAMLIALSMALLWQFYLIFYKTSINYSFQKEHKDIQNIYKNSIKIELSSLLYGAKEPLLAMIFLSLGEGIYSIFNYAHKFSAAIFQISTTPSLNRFITKLHYLIAQEKYSTVNTQIGKILLETVPIFIVSSIVFYFLMPYSMPLFFSEILTTDNLKEMQFFYLYMTLFYLVLAIEAPFSNTISAFKLFNYQLKVNLLFFLFLVTLYLLFNLSSFVYYTYLLILVLAQVNNLLCYVYKSKFYLKKLNTETKNI